MTANIYEKMSAPLGDADIRKLLNNKVDVIVYEELEKYKSIEQLLPGPKSAVIILYQRQEGYGHWCFLGRYNKSILFFDPLGNRPDKQLLWTPKYLRKDLGQDIPHVSELLNFALDNGFRVTFSEIKFQKDADAVNTCGRHCVMIARYWFRSKNPTLKGYLRYMNDLMKHYELNYDLIVSKLI